MATLNPSAVMKANEELWQNHPELNRRQLTLGSGDAQYRKEWMQLYHKADQPPPAPPAPVVQPQPVPPPPPVPGDLPTMCALVPYMSHEEKMAEAIKRAPLSDAVRQTLGDPKVLVAQMVIIGGILAGIAATGYGAVAEGIGAGLLVIGAAMSGYQIGSGLMKLYDFYEQTRCDRAKTPEDLDAAGKTFAAGTAETGVGGLNLAVALLGARGKSWTGAPLDDPNPILTEQSGKLVEPRGGVRPQELGPDGNPVPSDTLQIGAPGNPIQLDESKSYLFAVDENGNVLVAENRPFTTTVNGQEVTVPRTGHPNLTGGAPARIAGELNFDPESQQWVMNNDSGRYGFDPSRTSQNLDAAAQLLRNTGTDAQISTQFIPPKW